MCSKRMKKGLITTFLDLVEDFLFVLESAVRNLETCCHDRDSCRSLVTMLLCGPGETNQVG